MAFAVQDLSEIESLLRKDIDEYAVENNSFAFVISKEMNFDTEAGAGAGADNAADSNESNSPEYSGILDTDLTALTQGQRSILMTIVLILFALSLFGNCCTLYVNTRRKIRPFFRACLISLACGDIMNTIFLTTAYVSQFTADYVQIWRLGSIMCSLVPFATTTAILASSMTLVGIALDRYFAVMKAVIGFWNPDVIFCGICMFFIWVASIGISSPVFCIYTILPVYILSEDDDGDGAYSMEGINTTSNELQAEDDVSYVLVHEQELVHMCVSDTRDVTIYYVVVFVIIFIPSIVAFVWLNSVIARKLWTRRHRPDFMKPKKRTCLFSFCCRKNDKQQQQSANETLELECNATATTTPTPTPPTADAPATSATPLEHTTNVCTCEQLQTTTTTMVGSFLLAMGNGIGAVPIKVKTKKILQQLRHQPQCQAQEPPITIKVNRNSSSSTSAATASAQQNTREVRHMRMFIIILIMMAAFIFLRLPAWVFLIMRMYGSYSRPVDWILYFSFGILHLTSCCLNPLFYTFLTQTIQYFLRVKEELMSCFCCCCRKAADDTTTTELPAETPNTSCAAACCCNVGPLTTQIICQPAQQEEVYTSAPKLAKSQSKLSKSKQNAMTFLNSNNNNNNEKDEGVDCSEDGDSLNDDFNEYNQRIYTIFPPTLLSSSINSE